MAKVITTELQHSGASAANITLDSSKNVTVANNLTVTGAVSGGNYAGRNIIINGAMQVAQRGTSSTDNSYATVDRFRTIRGNTDEAPTQAQVALTSSDTGPWEKGFRKCLKVTNGNQTSGAGADDSIAIQQKIEAQNLANSGWNYNSTSSYITLSFWCKSSVAQNFYGRLEMPDGTAQNYPFETGALSANTWTKITKAIPGNSNITINDDTGTGMEVELMMFRGTDGTDSGVSLNTWAAYAGGTRSPDFATGWYTTNDATFQLTGVQLEVGDTATEFEHKSYDEELRKCQRYYEGVIMGTGTAIFRTWTNQSNVTNTEYFYKVEKRVSPTFSLEGNGTWHPGGDSGMSAYPSTSVCLFQRNDETGQFLTDANGDLCCSFSCEL